MQVVSSDQEIVSRIKAADVPRHIAIIPDGNRRWARKHKLKLMLGHKQGIKQLISLVEASLDLGVEQLTFFGFSTENWSRPKEEVSYLMDLLMEMISKYKDQFIKQKVAVQTIGDISAFGEQVESTIKEIVSETADGDRLVITIALNYGGRNEILRAVQNIVDDVKSESIEKIDETLFTSYLPTGKLPEPDLLIRTSGEMRISNFFIWQIAYTELYFTDTLWPDFKQKDLYQAIENFQNRKRRFGR